MSRKTLSRIAALGMSAMMIFGMASTVFAADEPALVTDKGSILIGATGGGSGETVVEHEYSIFKVMDKYFIGNDSDDQPIYQYKLTAAFAELADADGFVQFGDFKVDALTGKITYMDGEEEKVLDLETAGSGLNENENKSLGAKFATAVRKFVQTNNITADKIIKGGEVANNLGYGYYLIFETKNEADDGLVVTKPILLNLDEVQASITIKDAKIEIDKVITNGETPKKADFNVGDEVKYEVETLFPSYEADVDTTSLKFEVTDTLSKGLTFQNNIAVKVNDADATSEDYTYTRTENGFVLSFKSAYIAAHQGEAVIITYSGILNENAVIETGNPNDVSLAFTNDPANPSDYQTLEPEEDPTVYTYVVDLQKKDGTHDTYLAGAIFKLEREYVQESANANGGIFDAVTLVKDETLSTNAIDVYRPIKEGESTGVVEFTTAGKEIRFFGLDSGNYRLTEVKAPSGYAKLSGAIDFTIAPQFDAAGKMNGKAIVTSDSDAVTVLDDNNANATEFIADATLNINLLVKNYEGISLPETGAMTSLLVMGAGAAVIGGGLFVGLRRKKEDDED